MACSIVVAMMIGVQASTVTAQQRVETSPATVPTPAQMPRPVLGREAPWRGGPIPPGYVLHTTGRPGFVAAGSFTLALTYLPLAIGGAANGERLLALPVLGPLIVGLELIARSEPPCGPTLCLGSSFFDNLAGGLAIAAGVAQGAGIAMLVYGLDDSRQVLRDEPRRAGVRWAITPGAATTPLGGTLSFVHL